MNRIRVVRFLPLFLLLLLLLPSCSPRSTEEGSVRRGDVAFARGVPEEALAEYRLAERQGGENDAETLARVAHTYASMGRVDEAVRYYRRAAALNSRWADQAVSDLVRLARDARDRSDHFLMASSAAAALEFRPGLAVDDLALPLARHYFGSAEYGRALPFYQKALATTTDSVADVVMETAQAYDQVGDCGKALVLYERHRAALRPLEQGEVDWYIGNCSFQMARTRSEEEAFDEALAHIDRTLELGQPRNLQARAWFEKGEILSALGQCTEAVDAFRQVQWADPSGTGPLVTRAQRRIDQIRFGRGLEQFRSGGGCG